MFSPIYLKLEGKVPPPPQIKHECYRKQMISCEVSKYIVPIYPPLFLLPCIHTSLVSGIH